MNKNKWSLFLRPLYQPVFAILLALLVGAVIILINGENPFEIYGVMIKGSFGSLYYTLTTLNRATPIIICGLGAAIAWSSNYMGIGGEGQMIWGGFICSILALHTPGPTWLKMIVAVVGALIFGGLYSMLSAWLLDKFKMSLAISTLMLNYIAQYVTLHFVTNVFLDESGDKKVMQTSMLDETLRFPRLVEGYSLHIGFLFAVIMVAVMWFVVNKTTFGYESKMTGYNIDFCNYGGIGSKKIMYGVLFLSGVICAFAGASEVLGVQYRYVHNTYVSGSFAWVGLNAALISNYNPIGVLVTSIILAGIQTGGAAIARSTPIPMEISSVIQGCITLFISAKIVINFVKSKKNAKAATKEG
ncbi:ABC transporter permease [Oscillospiraceae bacterium PP1C4]